MSDDFMLDTDDLERRMDGAMANLRTEFASLRTGRASSSMLEPVMVDDSDQSGWHRERSRTAHGHDQCLGQGAGRQG